MSDETKMFLTIVGIIMAVIGGLVIFITLVNNDANRPEVKRSNMRAACLAYGGQWYESGSSWRCTPAEMKP
jgi:hypothetical protein